MAIDGTYPYFLPRKAQPLNKYRNGLLRTRSLSKREDHLDMTRASVCIISCWPLASDEVLSGNGAPRSFQYDIGVSGSMPVSKTVRPGFESLMSCIHTG